MGERWRGVSKAAATVERFVTPAHDAHKQSESIAYIHRIQNVLSLARTRQLDILVGYVLAFLFIYAAAWIIPYGYIDDYPLLLNSLRHQFSLDIVVYIQGGRPI